MKKSRILGVLVTVGILYLVILGVNLMSKPAADLGVSNGQLAACPDKPNCVSTQAAKEQHQIEPLSYSGEPSTAWGKLRQIVKTYPRATIKTDEKNYMHCTFRTALLGFYDDVEFLHREEESKIEFRSASRIGYSDLGANRKRMEEIRKLFAAQMDSAESSSPN